MDVPSSVAGVTKASSDVSLGRITKQQLAILKLIHGFRFVSTKHVQAQLGKRQLQQAQQRLNTLLDKHYIGRNFSSKDRLTGTYSSYYLLPDGIKLLKRDRFTSDKRVFHNIYKDKTASSRFIRHQLGIGDIYLEFKRLYAEDERLDFMTKSQILSNFDYDYEDNPDNGHWYEFLPEPLPDALVTIFAEDYSGQEYFLEYLEDSVPFFVYRNRIKFYEQYAEEGTWQDAIGPSPTPPILLVCESPTLQRRILRFLKRYMENVYEELSFYVTTLDSLNSASGKDDEIWRAVDEEPRAPRALQDMPLKI